VVQTKHRVQPGFVRPPASDRSQHRAGRPQTALRPLQLEGMRRSMPATNGYLRQQDRRTAVAGPRRKAGHAAGAYVLLALLSVVAIFSLRAATHRTPQSKTAASTAAARSARIGARPLWVDPQFIDTYQSQIAGYLAGRTGKYGLAAVDITTGKRLGIDQDDVFRAASVNKLELVIDLYRRAAAHAINLDASTVIGPDDVQNYGTGTIQLQGAGQTFTYRELASLMIEQSDNTASYVIGKRLGLDSVQADLQSWGLKQTSIADNYTTATDVALLLSQLQRGDLLPGAEQAEVLGLLQHTLWTDRLQTGVPSDTPVAHKIGTDVGVYNDAALVLNGSRPYIVVVLSAGTEEGDALATMTELSRQVYEFESGLPAVTREAKR